MLKNKINKILNILITASIVFSFFFYADYNKNSSILLAGQAGYTNAGGKVYETTRCTCIVSKAVAFKSGEPRGGTYLDSDNTTRHYDRTSIFDGFTGWHLSKTFTYMPCLNQAGDICVKNEDISGGILLLFGGASLF